MTVVGKNTIGGSTVTSSSFFHFGNIYTASASGPISAVNFYAAGGGSNSQQFSSAIYSVTAGVPITLLATGATVTVGATDAAQWYASSISLTLSSGTDYCIALVSGTTSAGANSYYDSVAGTNHFALNSGGITPDSSWGTDGTAPQQFSLYVDVMSGVSITGDVGVNTVVAPAGHATMTVGQPGAVAVNTVAALVGSVARGSLNPRAAWTQKTNALTTTAGTPVTMNTTAPSTTGHWALIELVPPTAVPSMPGNVVAIPGNTTAVVSWTLPASNGGSPIIDFTATSSPGGLTATASGATATSVVVPGLTNGTAYTFTVTARNVTGSSSASTASTAVTPFALQTQAWPTRIVEVAFANNPNTPLADLSWTDITKYCQDMTFSPAGRSHELNRMQPGTLSARVVNFDGRFSPFNTSSPYYGPFNDGRGPFIMASVASTDTTDMAAAAAGGFDWMNVALHWGTLQTSAGSALVGAAVTDVILSIQNILNAGMTPLLDLGLQYAGSWVTALVEQFVDAQGNTWDPVTIFSQNIGNWVWSQKGQTLVLDYITKIFAALAANTVTVNGAAVPAISTIAGITAGGLANGELHYPAANNVTGSATVSTFAGGTLTFTGTVPATFGTTGICRKASAGNGVEVGYTGRSGTTLTGCTTLTTGSAPTAGDVLSDVSIWGYGSNMQTGTNGGLSDTIANGTSGTATQSVCPLPGYVPFVGPSHTNAKDITWINWYLGGLAIYEGWLIGAVRSALTSNGGTCPIWVKHPNAGIRTTLPTLPASNATFPSYMAAVCEGLDHDRMISVYSTANNPGHTVYGEVYPDCTGANLNEGVVNTTPNGLWIYNIAVVYGVASKVIGENAGTTTWNTQWGFGGMDGPLTWGYYGTFAAVSTLPGTANFTTLASLIPTLLQGDAGVSGLVPMKRIRVRAVWNNVIYPLWHGYVDSWPQVWPDEVTGYVDITATDASKLLNLCDLSSVYYETVLANGPATWFRFGDVAGTQQLTSTVPGVATGAPGGIAGAAAGVTLGATALLPYDPNTSASFDGTTAAIINILNPGLTGGSFTVEMVVNVANTSDGISVVPLASQNLGGSTYGAAEWNIAIQPSGNLQFQLFDAGVGGLVGASTTAQTNGGLFNVGGTHHLVCTFNDATNTASIYIDGTVAASATGSGGGSLATEWVVLGNPIEPVTGSIQDLALYNVVLTAAQAAADYQAFQFPLQNVSPGAWVNQILTFAEWPSADRNIETGSSMLGPTSLAKDALSAINDAEDAEAGICFQAPDGTLTFYGRSHTLANTASNTSQITLGEGAEPYDLNGTQIGMDDLDVWNDIKVQRANGVEQHVQDITSQKRYGKRTMAITGLFLSTDGQAGDMADYLLHKYKAPAMRVAAVTVHPLSDPNNLFPQVLGRTLWDRITVTRDAPGGGSIYSQVAVIEKITHTITAEGDWHTEWALSPADVAVGWVLGDAVLGLLGSTTILSW